MERFARLYFWSLILCAWVLALTACGETGPEAGPSDASLIGSVSAASANANVEPGTVRVGGQSTGREPAVPPENAQALATFQEWVVFWRSGDARSTPLLTDELNKARAGQPLGRWLGVEGSQFRIAKLSIREQQVGKVTLQAQSDGPGAPSLVVTLVQQATGDWRISKINIER